MSRPLFIGSVCADVVIRVPHLPMPQEDLNIHSQSVSLGGCACNAARAARLMGSDPLLFAPAGTGIWGDWVRSALAKDLPDAITPKPGTPNGCCYCLIGPDGDRTFLCDHGAEYRFRPEWFRQLQGQEFDDVYICGLQIEEDTGDVIIDWLQAHQPKRLYFAPGPRIRHIQPQKMARLLAMSPILHLNEQEAVSFACCVTADDAARRIAGITGSDVIVTLGAQGALVCTGSQCTSIPGIPTEVVDTIGAGDSHIGAVIACRAAGMDLCTSVRRANMLSAAVVSHSGASITSDTWTAWQRSNGITQEE